MTTSSGATGGGDAGGDASWGRGAEDGDVALPWVCVLRRSGETAVLELEISSGKCQSEAGNSLTQLVLFGSSQQVSSRLLQT